MFSVIFIVLGYWLAAIIGIEVDKSVGFFTGFSIVMSNPFGRYFNNLTPVGMVLGFIVAEGIFVFLIMRNRRKEDNLDEYEFAPDIIDVADKAGMNYLDSMDVTKLSEKDLFLNTLASGGLGEEKRVEYVQPVDKETVVDSENDIQEQAEERQEELFFDDEIVTDLLDNYDLPQIAAMLQVKKYIEVDSAALLRKMFKPSMTAYDITSYIETFYE